MKDEQVESDFTEINLMDTDVEGSPVKHGPYRAYVRTTPQYIPSHGVRRYKNALKNLIPVRRIAKEKKVISVDAAGFFSFISYSWISQYMYRAYKSGLTLDDVPQCSPLDSSDLNAQRLELLWQKEVSTKGLKRASFGGVIWKFMRTRVFVSSLVFAMSLVMGFISPAIFMRKLLQYAEDEDGDTVDGVTWALCLTLAEFLRTVFFAWNWAISLRTATRLRSACLAMLYRKIIRLGNIGDKSVGELINLFANDGQRVYDMVLFGPMVIGGPIVAVCGVCYIFWLLGPWALLGMTVFLVFYPLQYGISRLIGHLRGKTVSVSDQRVKLVTEILNYMKFIKMYAWEKYFSNGLLDIRDKERKLLQKTAYCQSFSISMAPTVPVISAIITFLAHIGAGNNLTAAQAFPYFCYLSLQMHPILSRSHKHTMEIVDGCKAVFRLQAFSVLTFLTKFSRMGILLIQESSIALYEGLISATRVQAFPLVPFLGNQVKGVLSRIREGTRSVYEALVAFSRFKAFPLVSILNNQLRMSFNNVRIGIQNIFDGMVTFRRIKRILLIEEITPYIARPIDKTQALCISSATFTWDSSALHKASNNLLSADDALQRSNDPEKERLNVQNNADHQRLHVLSDINFQASKGQLIGICGQVGSGKTSLLLAALGQLRLLSGQVTRDGSCAYVSQEPWVLNATLKDNILFGETFDSKRYYEAIYCCSLSQDINMLPGGDQTEIGERGINLSGGQKQRVALARAIYANRDIYLLDDPLSAVDTHVGAHIFNKCILQVLKHKTVILVTHQIKYLSQCDEVYVMKDGRISDQGKHEELMERGQDYAIMVETCSSDKGDHEQISESEVPVDTEQAELSTTEIFANGNKRPVSSVSQNSLEEIDKLSPKGGEQLTAAEAVQKGSIRFHTYERYIAAAGGYCIALMVCITFLVNVGSTAFSSWWLATWIKAGGGNVTVVVNNVTKPSSNINDNPDFHTYQLVYALMIAVILSSSLIRGLVFTKVTLRASNWLHNRLFNKMMSSPMQFFETTPVGRIQNLFSRDMDEVDTRLPMTVEGILQNVWIVMFAILFICLVFPWAVIALLIVGIVFYVISKIFRAAVRDFKRIENVSRSPIFSWVGTTVQGLSTIHAFGKESEFAARFTKLFDENTTCLYMSSAAMRWLAVRLDTLAVIAVCVTSFLVILLHGQVSPALAGLALAYATHISGLFQYTIRLISETEMRFISVERINSYTENMTSEGTSGARMKPHLDWPSKGSIKFQNVVLQYRKGLPYVLKGVSFSIHSGEKIGIVGRTGSGKSSLVTALFRLVEVTSGKIKIDSLDIADVSLEQLRSRISVIPQDPVLFDGTIRSNLDPFEVQGNEAVWKALENTKLQNKVASLDKQLEAPVGKDSFSVGERQLLCLARALLRNTKILVLDEATAAVDPETEIAVQNTIEKQFKYCTVLIIAHRLSTITSCDRILVMGEGQILELDTPSNLLSDPNSHFSRMLSVATVEDSQANIS